MCGDKQLPWSKITSHDGHLSTRSLSRGLIAGSHKNQANATTRLKKAHARTAGEDVWKTRR